MKKIFSHILQIITLFFILSGTNVFALDSDGDLIEDSIDICPETLASPILSDTGVVIGYGVSVDTSGEFIGCSGEQKSADSDGDGISNLLDVCPQTGPTLVQGSGSTSEYKILTDQAGEHTGCSEDQKNMDLDQDGKSDFIDDDIDGDGLTNTEESEGWNVRIPFLENAGNNDSDYILLRVISDPRNPDTDEDGLNDFEEKRKGFNPNNSDTDMDGVPDNTDDEISSNEGRISVNEQGVYTPNIIIKNNLSDNDNDGILDSEDKCLNTASNQLVDETGEAKGCSEAQKALDIDGDNIPDYKDTDNDNDDLSDVDEFTGWDVRIPIENLGSEVEDNYLVLKVFSSPRNADSDGDGVRDDIEKIKGLNPNNNDTDMDGVPDNDDKEITSIAGKLYVDADGKYSSNIYQNADDDGDGIINAQDICQGSPAGGDVYTSGASRGCTTTQKIQSLRDADFDGIDDDMDICPGTSYANIASVGSNGCVKTGSITTTYLGSTYTYSTVDNLSIGGGAKGESSNVQANDKLQNFNANEKFIKTTGGGERGIYNTLIRIARDLKNLFYAIATVFFMIICLKLIFASNSEEEIGKFKKGIIWITIGLIVMQIAFSFTQIVFDRGVSATLGVSIIQYIVLPLIKLIQTLASIFFIAMAIYAFYRLVTANGNEEAVKNGKMTIVYAIIGFIVVRFAITIVEAFYGKIDCENYNRGFIFVEGSNCVNVLDISEGTRLIIQILNWMNSFVTILVLLMIIYAGVQILLSGGDEEKITKGKKSILYIAIGIAILVFNYLILTFFLVPDTATRII